MKLKSKQTAQQHQERVCRETIKNPRKAMLGGPSYSEARRHLATIGYSEKEIKQLES